MSTMLANPRLPAKRMAPRALLLIVVAMLVATTLLAIIARRTDIGATRISPPQGGYHVDLRFEDRERGAIQVTDVSGRLSPRRLEANEAGFVRVALRSMARERTAKGLGAETPFRVGRAGDGRLWIADPATGRLLYLDAYGSENARAFARLIEPDDRRKP